MGKCIEHLDSPPIDVLNMGTIQEHSLMPPKIGTAFTIKQGRPLLRNLAFQLEQDVPLAFLYFCDLQHRCISSCLNVDVSLFSNCNATASRHSWLRISL